MFKFLEIEGDSMYPFLKDKERVLCIKPIFSKYKINDIVIFTYKDALMIKRITKIDDKGYYVEGTNAYSIDSSIFGYLKEEDILFKMIFKF